MKSTDMWVLGMMSGSSLDGLDMALCTFKEVNGRWSVHVEKAMTVPYPDEWHARLKNAPQLNATDLKQLDYEYGQYLAQQATAFLAGFHRSDLIVASHGHTVRHAPDQGYSLQIGNGLSMATQSGLTIINDFRTDDIKAGGQGAPLVPIGDELLYGDYDACLNLGGIANISRRENGKRTGWDIGPANQWLNFLAQKAGIPYDMDGSMAASGNVIPELLETFNRWSYYGSTPPKSLSNQQVMEFLHQSLDTVTADTGDLLATATSHIAHTIAMPLNQLPDHSSILVTGGGAHNKFLMDTLQRLTHCRLVIPDAEVIDFKEAIVFAFMGMLRYHNRINCLASVTGARHDSSCGTIHTP